MIDGIQVFIDLLVLDSNAPSPNITSVASKPQHKSVERTMLVRIDNASMNDYKRNMAAAPITFSDRS